MTTIAISSFSLHRELGPLTLQTRDEAGQRQTLVIPMPATHTLEQFGERVATQYGLRAIEICQLQVQDHSPERIARLRASLDAAGVRVTTVPIDSGDLTGSHPERLEEDIADIIDWFDIAVALGATFVRVNSGLPHGDAAKTPTGRLVDALRRLAAEARRRHLRLLVENHGGASSDPDYLLELREAVGPENLGILLDLGNFEPINQVSGARFRGEEVDDLSIDTEVVYERIAKLAPVADLVHVKAYDPRSDGSPLLDLERALAVTRDAGYEGDISIEWEGAFGDPWEQTGDVLETVRRCFPATPPATPATRIQHTVAFRLHHEAGSPEAAAFLSDARSLLSSVPGVEQFTINQQVSAQSDLTHQFSMWFADQAAYSAYDAHPVHVAFVEERWKVEVAEFQELDFVGV